MYSTGQKPLWVPQPVTQNCFAGPRIHRLHPSPVCSHHSSASRPFAEGLPSDAPHLLVLQPFCGQFARGEAAAARAVENCGVYLGEKGHTQVFLLPAMVQLQQHASCTQACFFLHRSAQRISSLSLGKQGGQKSFLCLILGFQ